MYRTLLYPTPSYDIFYLDSSQNLYSCSTITGTTLVDNNVYSFGVGSTGQLSVTHCNIPGAEESPNWSGYCVDTSLTTPQANSVTFVEGVWTVPTVSSSTSNSAYSCVSVAGMDGFLGSTTVEQIGTEQDVINGSPNITPGGKCTRTTGPTLQGAQYPI